MIAPTEADIGRRVIYHPSHGRGIEEGIVTSFNAAWVFVRYGADTTSQATPAERLEWANVSAVREGNRA